MKGGGFEGFWGIKKGKKGGERKDEIIKCGRWMEY